MDTADLQVMSSPPFDPASDVRITHTVRQGRTNGGDGNHLSGGVILNHYLRGPSVGKGQHGTVYHCWDLAQDSAEVVRLLPPLFFISFHLTTPYPHLSDVLFHPFILVLRVRLLPRPMLVLCAPFPILSQAIKVVSRHNPRADRLNQLKRKRIPRSGPHLPVTDNLGSQEYKIKKEIAVMKLCRHPHVVRLVEVIDDKLYQKVYMGQFVSVSLLPPSPLLSSFFVLCAGFLP